MRYRVEALATAVALSVTGLAVAAAIAVRTVCEAINAALTLPHTPRIPDTVPEGLVAGPMTAPERAGPERAGPDYPAEWDREPDEETAPEPNDGPGPDGHHSVTGECFACLVGVVTGPESHGDRCPLAGGNR